MCSETTLSAHVAVRTFSERSISPSRWTASTRRALERGSCLRMAFRSRAFAARARPPRARSSRVRTCAETPVLHVCWVGLPAVSDEGLESLQASGDLPDLLQHVNLRLVHLPGDLLPRLLQLGAQEAFRDSTDEETEEADPDDHD